MKKICKTYNKNLKSSEKNREKNNKFQFFFQIHEMAGIFTKLMPKLNHEMAGITNCEITKCGDLLY